MTRVGKKQDVKKSTETSLETPRLGQTISPSAEPRTSNEVLHVCGNSPSIQQSPGGAKIHVADLKQPKDCKGPLAKSTEKSSQKQQSPLIGWLKRRSVTRNKMTSQRNDMELGQGEKTLKNSRSFLRERFFTLSQRDKQAFRVQMSILFPCVFKRPSLKFVQQALGEMKEHIVTTVGHLNLVRENPALTESLAQRTLYRKELINEHGMKPSKELAPGLVPICQKNSSSHMIERKANSPTRAKKSCYQIKYRNMGEDHVQTCADQSEKFEESQQVSFDSSHRRSKDVTHTGDDPMSSFSSKQPNAPKIENTQRNWRHNLMVNSDLYSGGDNRERLWSVPQTALSSGISPVNQPVREGIRQLYCLENSPSIPEWFSNLYGKGCVLELQPTVPSDLSIRSDEVKNFLRIPLRLVIQPVNCRLLSTDEASMRFYIIVTEQEQLPTTPEPRGLPPTPVLSSDGIALYQVKDIGRFDACNEKIYSRTQLLRKHGNKSEGDNGSISEDISRDSGIPVSSSDTFFPSERKISFRHSWKWFDTSKGVKKSGVKSGWSVKRLNLRRLRSRRKQYTRGLVMEIRHGILFEGPARCVHVGQNTSWWRCWTLKTAKSKNVGLSKATRTQWNVVQSPPLCSSGELKPVTPMMQYDLDKAFPQPSTDGLQTEPKDLKNMIKGKHSFVTKLSKTQNHSYRNSSTLKGGEQKRLQDTISKGIPLGMKNIKLIKNRRRRSQACSGEGMLSERTDLRGGQNPAKTYEVGMDKMPAHTSEMFPKAEKSSTKEKGTEKSVVRKRNRAGHTGRVGDKGVSHLNKSNSSLPQQKGVSEHANAHDDDHSFVMDALDCICEGADNSSVQTLDRVGRIENDGKIEERDSLPKTEKIERSAKKCDRVKFFNPQDDSLQKLCKKNDAASFQDSTGNKSNPRASSSSLSNYSSSTATSFLMRKHRRESNDMGYQGHTEKISSNKHSLSEFIKEQWRIISEGDPQNVVTPKYTLDIPGKSDGLFKLRKHQLSPKNPHKPMEKHLLDTQNGCEDLESESQVQQLNKGDSSEESCKHRNEQAFVSDNTVIREYTRELIQKILERRRGCRSPSSEQNIKSPKSHVSFSTKDTVIEDRICTNSKKHPRPGKCRQSVASSEFEFGNPMSIFKAEQSRITCHNTVSTELLNTIDVRSISTSTKSKPDEMFEAGIQGNLSNRQLCAQEKNGVYELLSPLWELNQTWSNMSQEGTHTSSSPTPEEVLPSPPRPKRKRSTDSVEEKNDSEGEPERSGGSQKDDEATAEMPKTQKSLGKEEKTSPSRQSISTRTSSRRSSTDPATQLKQRLEKLPGGSNAPQPHSRSSRTRENSHRDQTPNRPRDLKRSCLSADLRELEGIIEAWLLSTLSKNSKRQGKPGSPCSEDENGRGSERSETSTKADSQLPRNAALRSRAKGDPKYDKSSQKDSRLREYSSEEEKALSITESDHLSLHCSCKESYTSSEEGKVLSKAKRHPRSFHCSCKKIRATNEEKKITSKTKEVPKPHQPPCKESCTGSEDETLVPRHKSSSKSFQCSCEKSRRRGNDDTEEQTDLQRKQRVFEDALLGYRLARAAACFRHIDTKYNKVCYPETDFLIRSSLPHSWETNEEQLLDDTWVDVREVRHQSSSEFTRQNEFERRNECGKETRSWRDKPAFTDERDTKYPSDKEKIRVYPGSHPIHQLNDIECSSGAQSVRNQYPYRYTQSPPCGTHRKDASMYTDRLYDERVRPHSCDPRPPGYSASVSPGTSFNHEHRDYLDKADSADDIKSSDALTSSQAEALAYINYMCSSGRMDPKAVADFGKGFARNPDSKKYVMDPPKPEKANRILDTGEDLISPNRSWFSEKDHPARNNCKHKCSCERNNEAEQTNYFPPLKDKSKVVSSRTIEICKPETTNKGLQLSMEDSENSDAQNVDDSEELKGEEPKVDHVCCCCCCCTDTPVTGCLPDSRTNEEDFLTWHYSQRQPSRSQQPKESQRAKHVQSEEVQCSLKEERKIADCNNYSQVIGVKSTKQRHRHCSNKKCQVGSPLKLNTTCVPKDDGKACKFSTQKMCTCTCKPLSEMVLHNDASAEKMWGATPGPPCGGSCRVVNEETAGPHSKHGNYYNRVNDLTTEPQNFPSHNVKDAQGAHCCCCCFNTVGSFNRQVSSQKTDKEKGKSDKTGKDISKAISLSQDSLLEQGSTLDACCLDIDSSQLDRSPIVHIRYRSRPVPVSAKTAVDKRVPDPTKPTCNINGSGATSSEMRASLKKHIAEILQQTREIQRTANEIRGGRGHCKEKPLTSRKPEDIFPCDHGQSTNQNGNANSLEGDTSEDEGNTLNPECQLTKSQPRATAILYKEQGTSKKELRGSLSYCQDQNTTGRTVLKNVLTCKSQLPGHSRCSPVNVSMKNGDRRNEKVALDENPSAITADAAKNIERLSHYNNKSSNPHSFSTNNRSRSFALTRKSSSKCQRKAMVSILDPYEETLQYLRKHEEELSKPYESKRSFLSHPQTSHVEALELKETKVMTPASSIRKKKSLTSDITCTIVPFGNIRNSSVPKEQGQWTGGDKVMDVRQTEIQVRGNNLLLRNPELFKEGLNDIGSVKFPPLFSAVEQPLLSQLRGPIYHSGTENATDLDDGVSLIVNDSKASSHGIEEIPLDTVSSDKSVDAASAQIQTNTSRPTTQHSVQGQTESKIARKCFRCLHGISTLTVRESNSPKTGGSPLWTSISSRDSELADCETLPVADAHVDVKGCKFSASASIPVSRREEKKRTASSETSDTSSDQGSRFANASPTRSPSSLISQDRVLTPSILRVKACEQQVPGRMTDVTRVADTTAEVDTTSVADVANQVFGTTRVTDASNMVTARMKDKTKVPDAIEVSCAEGGVGVSKVANTQRVVTVTAPNEMKHIPESKKDYLFRPVSIDIWTSTDCPKQRKQLPELTEGNDIGSGDKQHKVNNMLQDEVSKTEISINRKTDGTQRMVSLGVASAEHHRPFVLEKHVSGDARQNRPIALSTNERQNQSLEGVSSLRDKLSLPSVRRPLPSLQSQHRGENITVTVDSSVCNERCVQQAAVLRGININECDVTILASRKMKDNDVSTSSSTQGIFDANSTKSLVRGKSLGRHKPTRNSAVKTFSKRQLPTPSKISSDVSQCHLSSPARLQKELTTQPKLPSQLSNHTNSPTKSKAASTEMREGRSLEKAKFTLSTDAKVAFDHTKHWHISKVSVGQVTSANEGRVVIDGVHTECFNQTTTGESDHHLTLDEKKKPSSIRAEQGFPQKVDTFGFRIILFKTENSESSPSQVCGSYMRQMNSVNRFFKWRVTGVQVINQ